MRKARAPGRGATAGDVRAAAGQAVVGEGARPHDVGTGVVVFRVLEHTGRGIHHGADDPAGDVVGYGGGGLARKEALHDMRDHIGYAGSRLVGRQREGECGIHDGEHGAVEVGVEAALEVLGIVADDGGVRRFGARSGDGGYRDDGDALLWWGALREEVPHVAVIAGAEGDGLRSVHGRAAAHGYDYVNALRAGEFDALANGGDLGIGTHAAELCVGDASSVERCLHAIERAASDDRAAAVDDEGAREAECRQFLAGAVDGIASEDDLGGGVEGEVVHSRLLFLG